MSTTEDPFTAPIFYMVSEHGQEAGTIIDPLPAIMQAYVLERTRIASENLYFDYSVPPFLAANIRAVAEAQKPQHEEERNIRRTLYRLYVSLTCNEEPGEALSFEREHGKVYTALLDGLPYNQRRFLLRKLMGIINTEDETALEETPDEQFIWHGFSDRLQVLQDLLPVRRESEINAIVHAFFRAGCYRVSDVMRLVRHGGNDALLDITGIGPGRASIILEAIGQYNLRNDDRGNSLSS